MESRAMAQGVQVAGCSARRFQQQDPFSSLEVQAYSLLVDQQKNPAHRLSASFAALAVGDSRIE